MIVVVPVDPPFESVVGAELASETPLTAAEATRLYAASVADVVYAVSESGGDLLVNYRDEETLPDVDEGDESETAIRDLVESALGEESLDDDVRFERQVGSTHSARVGNTVTHLLEREGAASVCVLDPLTPLVRRTELDAAAMACRRHEVVLGPAQSGQVYLATFTNSIDFTDVYDAQPLSQLASRAVEEGLSVSFVPKLATVADARGLVDTLVELDARTTAGRPAPSATAEILESLDLTVDGTDLVRT